MIGEPPALSIAYAAIRRACQAAGRAHRVPKPAPRPPAHPRANAPAPPLQPPISTVTHATQPPPHRPPASHSPTQTPCRVRGVPRRTARGVSTTLLPHAPWLCPLFPLLFPHAVPVRRPVTFAVLPPLPTPPLRHPLRHFTPSSVYCVVALSPPPPPSLLYACAPVPHRAAIGFCPHLPPADAAPSFPLAAPLAKLP